MLKAIRLIKSDRKYGIEFIKGPWLDIGKDPEKIAARVYDIAGPALLENGTVSEDDSAPNDRGCFSSNQAQATGAAGASVRL